MIRPPTRILLAAQGYLELGHDGGKPGGTRHPARPVAGAQRGAAIAPVTPYARAPLELALDASRALCRLEPGGDDGFIHAAFCLHELGRTAEAKALLLSGPSALLSEATYHYNLGCYDAVLGNIEEAQAYLRASFKLDKKFREFARDRPRSGNRARKGLSLPSTRQ